MSRRSPVTAARRTLIWLGVLFAALALTLGGGTMWGDASWSPKLALDLEGGTQMILAPKVQGGGDEITQEQLEQAVSIIRQRVDGSGVSEAEITTQSGRNVVVSLPGIPDSDTRDLIQASAQMEFRPVLMRAPAPAAETPTPKDQLQAPTAKPTNGSDLNWVTPELQQKFEKFDCTDPKALEAAAEPADPDKPMISCEPDTGSKYILGPVAVPGTNIDSASFGLRANSQGQTLNEWAVNIDFNDDGTAKFKEVTSRLYAFPKTDPRNQFAIVLDGTVISAPTTNAVIPDGKPSISGNFTEDSAGALAEQLKYGALPISFEIQSEQQISATLGADQLRLGLISGIIGLALVAVYSLFQYRMLGLVTIASLVVAGVLTYLSIAILGWTQNYRLSLAGVAGLIVAIGQTADSFIVYFERIRDELRDGRNIVSAVENGWRRAKQTVLASKAVNLLAAAVLFFVAVGSVRGFAFTLGLTAIADLIVVFLFTHPMMQLLAKTKFFGGGHRWSGLDPRLLDVVPLYRGAGRVREHSTSAAHANNESAGSKPISVRNKSASKEAERRSTIAERRKAEGAERNDYAGSNSAANEENN